MATKKINYKSDFELIYTLTDNEGNPLSVPDNPWELWLSVGNPLGTNVRKFIAKYDGGDYTNCRVQDDTIIVIADNHKLPTGHLWTTFIDYQPNSDFPDGDKKIYTPQPCNVELITGAGDEPTETDIEILANYVVYEHNYVAGQGITIEGDVISATGESYTAGNQIVIDEGTINVAVTFTDMVEQHDTDIHLMGIDIASLDRRTTAVEESVETKASASDVTALGNRVTAVEGSITDLTVTDPALRQSDATTSGEIGKVVKVNEYGNYGQIVSDVVIVNEVLGGQEFTYALPHQEGTISITPDYTLADAADVAAVSQTVQGKADASDVTALANRVTTAEGSIADLTTGNNPALRASDKTTEKTIGKVAEYEDSGDTYLDPTTHQPIPQAKVPLLNTGDLYLDGVFRAGMDNKYALPHEGDEVKLRADYVLADEADVTQLQSDVQSKADTSDVSALDERVVVVETALPTKASTSSVNAIDGRVTTLENTYEDTMNIANNQLHELIDGKAQIAQALTDRGYPTQPTDSSASMAQKIENMEYGAGWFAQLGYTEDLDGGFKAEVRRVKEIQDALRNGALPTLRNRTDIYFINPGQLPDTTSMQYFFSGATNLRFVGEIVTNATDFSYFHYEGTTPIERIDRIVSPNATTWHRSLSQIKSIGYIDFASAVTLTAVFYSGNNQIFIEIHNLGKAPACTSAQLNGSSVWGAGSEENRQSLVDSLLTYSFDRAAAGYSTCTITLHADTLARLAQEEIAAITAKGFTLTA